MINSFIALWVLMLGGADVTVTTRSIDVGPQSVPAPEITSALEDTGPVVDQDIPDRVLEAGISCEIRRDAASKKIVAVVSAGKANSGTFDFTVESRGANSIKTHQRGTFDVEAGESKQLRAVKLVGDGQTITGKLSLTADNGKSTTCSMG